MTNHGIIKKVRTIAVALVLTFATNYAISQAVDGGVEIPIPPRPAMHDGGVEIPIPPRPALQDGGVEIPIPPRP